jgi:hypothetical protein
MAEANGRGLRKDNPLPVDKTQWDPRLHELDRLIADGRGDHRSQE